MQLPEVRPQRLAWVAVGLTIWGVALWSFWISEPLVDAVAVVANPEQTEADLGDGTALPAAVPADPVNVVCSSPWQARSGPDDPLPALGEGESYDHAPCVKLHRDNRIVLGMNGIVVAMVFGSIVVLSTRRAGSTTRSNGDGEETNQDRTTVDSES